MHTPKQSIPLRSTLAACAIALAIGAGSAFAADAPAPAHPAPSMEMRAKMATMHEQMAACLRSDKVMATCHEEMMKSCHDTMGEKGCPMMGMRDHAMTDNPMEAMPAR
jgi:hypothetical protein